MNMITLAARAILKSRYYEPEFHPDLESFYASCYPEHVMEAEAEARAVIEAMRGWQSMENAPEDGSRVLLTDGAEVGFGRFVIDRGKTLVPDDKPYWEPYDHSHWDIEGDEWFAPTKWMSVSDLLASPPTPEDAGER